MSDAPKKPGIRQLHQSEVQTFLTCGKQWEFRYVLGIKTPPKAYFTVGRSVDSAINHNLIQKIESGTDLAEADVLDACATEFDKEALTTEWGEDKPGEEKDSAIACIKAHLQNIAPLIQPETIQEKFVLETSAGFNLGGTIDIVEKSGKVRDSKTAKSKYDEDAIFRAIQPSLYDFAYEALRGKPSTGFAYDVMIKPKQLKTKYVPAETQIVEGKVTPQDRQWLFETVHQVDKAIQAGIALPAPEKSWVCSEKWCGYWHMCKGKK